MMKLRRNIKGQNGGRNGGESGDFGTEIGKRKTKKGFKLGRFYGITPSEQLSSLVFPAVSFFLPAKVIHCNK
jgi:hypothetical protein